MTEDNARRQLMKATQSLVMAWMGWSEDQAREWMATPNPCLGNVEPFKFIFIGRSHKLLAFIEGAISEGRQE